ncbi:hypothetical protein GTW43_03730, partial [Streptomyces sp. SID5785]|uniref:hypothetical protein n=1 Tax=Streptomyces sp. SID5785 TaxID=2690309 RepID=UPI001361A6C1
MTPPDPTPAERARTVLAAADSLTLTVATGTPVTGAPAPGAPATCTPATRASHRVDCVALHAVDAASRLLLLDPAEPGLTAALTGAPRSGLAVHAEFTDVAPVAVRDRVRARLMLSGRLTTAGPDTLVLRPARAVLVADGARHELDAGELGAAAPDPLAGHEAELLAHLDAGHADILHELAALTEVSALTGAARLRPVRLDRAGLVLRGEAGGPHTDVRI